MVRPISDPVERFNSYVDRSGDCHTWTGTIDTTTGYGVTTVDGKKVAAHRYAWEIANGCKIPHGKKILHSCDNRPCVNPAHLRPGTQIDNSRDCVERGRHPCGETSARSVLTEKEVREIRHFSENGLTQREIAGLFQVSRYCVRAVIKRETWKHVN